MGTRSSDELAGLELGQRQTGEELKDEDTRGLIDGKRIDPRRADPSPPKRSKGSRRCYGIATLVFLLMGISGAVLVPRDRPDYEIDIPEGVSRAAFPAPRENKVDWVRYHDTLKARANDQGGEARVVVLGDSITEEMMMTSQGVPKDWGRASEIWEEFYAPLGSLNLGMSGDQTQHLLWRMQNGELPDVLQPEVFVVAIGTNNLGSGMSPEETVTGIEAILQYLRKQRPDTLVCAMALFPRANPFVQKSDSSWDAVDEVNTALEHQIRLSFTEDQVLFVDCGARFLMFDDNGNELLNHEMILGDNLHLTPGGLRGWAECVQEGVQSGLATTSPTD